ncbi:MAG: hypothetical protein ABL962_10785 [Fimbriimonadaceae bacterium]
MGDKKPKKTSSGSGDKHKAKQAQDAANRPLTAARLVEDKKGKKK